MLVLSVHWWSTLAGLGRVKVFGQGFVRRERERERGERELPDAGVYCFVYLVWATPISCSINPHCFMIIWFGVASAVSFILEVGGVGIIKYISKCSQCFFILRIIEDIDP
jgi:hypothetical protein